MFLKVFEKIENQTKNHRRRLNESEKLTKNLKVTTILMYCRVATNKNSGLLLSKFDSRPCY